MVPYKYSLIVIFLIAFHAKAQDTLNINEIRLTTSLAKQSLLRSTAAAAIIDSSKLRLLSETSLVSAFNTVPGLRMEERSPGSYRLSIRGSLLRSPFGIRNVKMYLNEYPLTDAGGNTYINVLALNAVGKIEILKGPDGSLFGANSGGVVTLNTVNTKDQISAAVAAGSWGLFRQSVGLTKQKGNHLFDIAENYQRSDGYRQNSSLHRFYVHVNDQWQYSKNNTLKALVFYSELFYQTPGGLTQLQYDSSARQARPATATLPSASAQKASVKNNMLFAGITHVAAFHKNIEHTAAVFASTVDFKNPFISNYETRKENTYGLRTFFTFSNNKTTDHFKWEYDIGTEWQQTRSAIDNYENKLGSKGNIIASGDVLSDQHFVFNKIKFDIQKKLLVEAGLSLNDYRYRFKDSFALNKHFDPQWMPRLALSYTAFKKLTARASLGRGYSPPTTAEVRPSDNKIYTQLQAETGVNIELGLRYTAFANRLWIDLAAYNYHLKDAIVRQQNAQGDEFFTNAGGTLQKGLELQVSYTVINAAGNNLIRKIQLSNSSTLNDFKFNNYTLGVNNYSGNRLTGVPKACIVSSVLVELKGGPYLFIQHNYNSSIPLNDANTFVASPYNLVQLKTGYVLSLKKRRLELYGMADNLLNQKYSLGNDLNAAGNRFFNAAPLRNYTAGVVFTK